MNPEYIVIQAGGKGSRMESLTRNKPKALIPIDNLPMIFHLFRKFPEKKFIVIGDYKYKVLEKYLKTFADVEYNLVCATGHIGTCSGINQALTYIPDHEPFMLIWCDLILPEDYKFPEKNGNYVGISKDFSCRWSFKNSKFAEEKSSEHGVAGHFILQEKAVFSNLPNEGELVKWLSGQNIIFEEQILHKTHEYGLYSEWEKLPKRKCRPFNKIIEEKNTIIKLPIGKQGESLAAREIAWYRKIDALSTGAETIGIPKIFSYEPLSMERINGKNVYEYTDIPRDQKEIILKEIVDILKRVHSLETVSADKDSFMEAYVGKTKTRLEKIRELVPFANDREIIINGRKCRNIFYQWEEVTKEVEKFCPEQFVLLHGDCTFSNIMIGRNNGPILIDPRGYFGNTELFGDSAYDWAKLYYSLVSNYDQFNLKRFSLDIGENDVHLQIESSHWEDMEDVFFELLDGQVTRKQMKLFLAIIWLSFTTYAWEDYDSICGAFYNGLLYLEDALLMSDQGMGDRYFEDTMRILSSALNKLDMNTFEEMLEDAEKTLRCGHKIVASGLGKNVPVCEKFVGTMLSMGLNANFLHTNSAIHGDMGMIKSGDMVIILSKSGDTSESVYLSELLLTRDVNVWLLTFSDRSMIERIVGSNKTLVIHMEHEGDMWNIVPNNSTTLNLIVLQGLAMSMARRFNLSLERDFKPNHPGGAIGERLKK